MQYEAVGQRPMQGAAIAREWEMFTMQLQWEGTKVSSVAVNWQVWVGIDPSIIKKKDKQETQVDECLEIP